MKFIDTIIFYKFTVFFFFFVTKDLNVIFFF